MTKHYTSLLLQVPKQQNHQAVVLEQLSKLAYTKNIKANNPNLIFFDLDKVSIEIVRAMISESALGIYSGNIRVMVLTHLNTASIPAQNALLKLIEEPPANTQIILTTETTNQILPTILSRCLLITSSKQPSPPSGEGTRLRREGEAGEVLPATYSAAIDLAEKYKDREAAIDFVENLIISLQKENGQKPSKKTTKNLQILSQTLQHLRANVNVRLALEHGMFGILE